MPPAVRDHDSARSRHCISIHLDEAANIMSESAKRSCLLCFVIYAMKMHLIHGDGTELTSNVHAGQNITLPCHTNLEQDVDWMYQSTQDAQQQYVYSNGVVYKSFIQRFRVESPSAGDFNLVIHNVQPHESGVYTCGEDGGLGTKHIMKLIVVGEQMLTTIQYETSDPETTQSNTITIVVAAVAGALVLVIVTVVVIIFCRRNRGHQRIPTASNEDPHETIPLQTVASESNNNEINGPLPDNQQTSRNELSPNNSNGHRGGMDRPAAEITTSNSRNVNADNDAFSTGIVSTSRSACAHEESVHLSEPPSETDSRSHKNEIPGDTDQPDMLAQFMTSQVSTDNQNESHGTEIDTEDSILDASCKDAAQYNGDSDKGTPASTEALTSTQPHPGTVDKLKSEWEKHGHQ